MDLSKQFTKRENATECVRRVQMSGRRETYPSGKNTMRWMCFLLMQHEHRNHSLNVVATDNSNTPACYEYLVTATYLPYGRSSFTDLVRGTAPTGHTDPEETCLPKTEEKLYI